MSLTTPNATTKESKESDVQIPSWLGESCMMILSAVAIYTIYFIYALVHESIYKSNYGDNGDKFDSSLFLVGFQSIINGLFAFCLLKMNPPKVPDVTPKGQIAQVAFSYMGAMFASNFALQFVNYPTQVLVKSVKMIPVMLSRLLFVKGTSYSLREYLTVVIISLGVAVFVFQPNRSNGEATSIAGLGLCAISLALDGFTGPNQERMRDTYKTDKNVMMLYLNIFAVGFSVVALFATGQMGTSIEFLVKYPEVLPKIVVFSLLSAIGQAVILAVVFRFDALVLTTITTTRKFFTILFSVLWYGNVVTPQQWVGVALVFAGLLSDGQNKAAKKAAKKKAKAAKKALEMTDMIKPDKAAM